MGIMKLGLLIGAAAFLYVGWASWNAGYRPEVAAVRAALAFMAVSVVAYAGELVVSTAPPDRRAGGGPPDAAQASALGEDGAAEPDGDADEEDGESQTGEQRQAA